MLFDATAQVFPEDLSVGGGCRGGIASEVKEMETFEAQVFEQLSNYGRIIGLYPPNAATKARYQKTK